MLLLVYVLLSAYQAVIALIFPVYHLLTQVLNKKGINGYSDLLLISAFCLVSLLTVTITLFFKFHVKLILSNSTTIENMDKKNLQKDVYNKGMKNNWLQVFGKNKWLWMIPVTGISGKPIGDGVIWTQENYNHVDEDVPENENDIRKSLTLSGTGNIAQILAKESSKNSTAEKNKGVEIKRKEESDTKSSSIDSIRLGKHLNIKPNV